MIAFVDLVPVTTDKVRQSYPVEYYLESVEEHFEGKIHKNEREPGNGNVNTVYFVNQARGNAQISRTGFVYDEVTKLIIIHTRLQMFLIFELPA